MTLITLLLGTLAAAEILPVAADGAFEAPRNRCIRVFGEKRVTVRVNGLAAGDTSAVDGSLDITGFLRPGARNRVEMERGVIRQVLSSPLVYLSDAESDGKTLRIVVVNTTEHTMQVEAGGADQFTVSPGTSVERSLPDPRKTSIRIRATSDGLDLSFEDEIPVLRRGSQ